MYMLEVFDIGGKINKMCHSKDVLLRDATVKMKKKYEKYWGKPVLLTHVVVDVFCLRLKVQIKICQLVDQ